jgi:predicted PurR-regulated permease PerM
MRLLSEKLRLPRTISAIVILLVTLIFIFTPLILFIGLVAREAYVFVQTFDQNVLWQFFDQYSNFTLFGFEISIESFKDSLQGILQNAGQTIYGMATYIGMNIANFTFLFFVFIFLYVFFLIDAEKLLKNTKKILPFTQKRNEILLKKFHHVSKTVFVGNVLSATLAGIAAYTGFTIFNIPGAIIWGLLAALLSLIPTIGTLVVYLLGAIIVYFISGIYSSLFILAFYIVVDIILIQSIIKPKLVDEKIAIHPIFVFLAIIGGIRAFGSIGLIYGPLIVVLFVTMFEFIVNTEKEK